MQFIGITGGTGFIGHHLSDLLLQQGFKVLVFTRDMHLVARRESVKYSYWNPDEQKFDLSYFDDIVGVINLAGASLDKKRWTAKRKQEIIHSREHSTAFLIEKLREHAPNCKTLISASAINYYGADKGKTPFDENDRPANDFLGTVCRKWEEATHHANDFLRTVILRFGIVLGKDEGAFPKLARPQTLGLVPIIGSGKQMMSWIHISDLCNMIVWALTKKNIEGALNAVAPYPVSQRQLLRVISQEKGGIKIPFHVPNSLLKLLMGEMPIAVMQSMHVSADKVQQAGFQYKFPQVETAVKSILKRIAMDKHNHLNTQTQE